MRKKLIATAAGVVILIGSSAAALEFSSVKANVMDIIKPNKTEEQIDAEMGIDKTQPTEADFKEYLHEFNTKASEQASLQFENKLEKKIAQRTFVEMKQAGKSVDVKNLRKEVKEQAKYEKAWLKHAKNEYGIKVTPKEIDDWISKGPDKSPVDTQKAFAGALGMSLKDLNHNYYRDQYEKWVVWEKLRPIIAEKYGIKESSYENVQVSENTPVEEMSFNNKVLSLYEKEVTSSMN
jgi:hypothetical protein